MSEFGFLGSWAASLQSTDFSWAGSPVSRAEWLGALLGLIMVVCNARGSAWGWPLAMCSSLLYALVFLDSRLYGQAALQLVFVAMAAWGLWEWLRNAPAPDGPSVKSPADERLQPRLASACVLRRCGLAALLLWGLLGTLLAHTTDSPAPYADALPTAGSLVATWMLARKYHENWLAWLAVNVCAVLLFAQQRLWPTVVLYAVFALMSAWGWWMWRRASQDRAA